jgi:hypothetical protein
MKMSIAHLDCPVATTVVAARNSEQQLFLEGSAVDRKLWLTKMHSAIAAAAAPPQCVGPDDNDTAPSSTQSAYTRLAFSSYEEYRRHSGIMATKHSNMAKRVRL